MKIGSFLKRAAVVAVGLAAVFDVTLVLHSQ